MLNPKPYDNCGGCKLYLSNCHCLCHVSIEAPGYHEIIYSTNDMENSPIIKEPFE